MNKTSKFNKYLGWSIVVFGFLFLLMIGIQNRRVLMPNLYFSHHLDYRQYSVYADRPINRGVPFILREVTTKLQTSELYSGSENFRIFLCYNPEKYAHFAREITINPKSQGFTMPFTEDVFINLKAIGDIGQTFGNRHPYTLLSGSATHIITHELTHLLITNKLGYLDSRNLTDWKREGYAEYVASKNLRTQDTTYALKHRVRRFISGDYKKASAIRRSYVRAGLMVEYLMDIEGLGFEQLASTSVNPDSVFRKIQKWTEGRSQ